MTTASLPLPIDGANIDDSDSNLRNAYLCYFFATVIMTGIAWYIFDGVKSTEPDSPARTAKIVSCIGLLFTEGFLFSLASQMPKHAFILRLSACLIFVLQVILMSVAQISIGTTAAKASLVSAAKINEITEGAQGIRDAAKDVRKDADRLRRSKHSWERAAAGEKSDTALAALTAASGVSAALSKVNVSTPSIEVIGENGFIGLSIFLSIVMEFVSIALMHTAGSLRREALAAQAKTTVEYQILSVVQDLKSGLQPQPAPALTTALTPSAKALAKGDSAPIYSFSKTFPYATISALSAAAAAPTVMAAPAPIAPAASIPSPAAPEAPVAPSILQVANPVNDDPIDPVNDNPIIKTRKARVAHDGAVMDTGVGEHDGYRYRRALEGVRAGVIRPSRDGLASAVGVSPPTIKRYLAAMAEAGVIVPSKSARGGWVLATMVA